MSTQDDACAMAFAVLRNRGYRFLAVSADGVVVSNGSPTLAIDVSRPVHATKEPEHASHKRKLGHRRHRMPHAYVAKATGYPTILKAMNEGDHYTFPLVPGSTVQSMAMVLSNASHRTFGSGHFSIKSSPEGITVTRK